jgi:hypothetical protein
MTRLLHAQPAVNLPKRYRKNPMHPEKSTKPGRRSRPFNAAEHQRSEAEVAAYIAVMTEDGDPRALAVALRTAADFMRSKTLYRPGPREDRDD